MNGKTVIFSLVFMLIGFGAFCGDEEWFTLDAIEIVGNERTKEAVIRSCLSLAEGDRYGLQDLLARISRSKENLEKTGLFADVLFDDRADDENRLTLTVRLREKNYAHTAPSGYLVFRRSGVESRSGVAFTHGNLFGNGSLLSLEVPLYEETGFIADMKVCNARGVETASGAHIARFGVSGGYARDFKNGGEWFTFAPSASFRAGERSFIGAEARANRDGFSSFLLAPYFETGSKERESSREKKWSHARFSPYYGYNFTGSSQYGFDAEGSIFRDLLLEIVFATSAGVSWQGGEVPDNLLLTTRVRGNRFGNPAGEYRISSVNELRVPLPWKKSVVVVPFLDAAVIGERSCYFIMGGGLGLRWYTKCFDPLLLDVAFGRGVMVNFRKSLSSVR